MGLIRETGLCLPTFRIHRRVDQMRRESRRKFDVKAQFWRVTHVTSVQLHGHCSDCGVPRRSVQPVASVGKSSGNAVETQSNIETAQRPAQCSPEPVRSTGNNRRMAHRVQSCLESSAGVMPMVRFLHPPPIIHFYPRFDKTRRTGSAMTAPSGDHSATIPHKIIALAIISDPL